ncbi:MAG: polysaccharide deacetylase family protein [Limnochordaceae bacterium]|nr:polysaccharide deacetylase family protein [Limnochordaceae bacterium]
MSLGVAVALVALLPWGIAGANSVRAQAKSLPPAGAGGSPGRPAGPPASGGEGYDALGRGAGGRSGHGIEPGSELTPEGPFTPNRMGSIPILEFHRLGARMGRWQLTSAAFAQVIDDLYRHGFRPVNFVDVVTGHISLGRGYAPVVLTFDDGDPSQFSWAPGQPGRPDPQCAVGILWQFHEQHPDWALKASFYVNAHPFGQDSAAKVRWLVAHGFEVGDHTLHHVFLNRVDAKQAEAEIGGVAAWVQTVAPGYHVQTLAYPFGAFDRQLADSHVWSGVVDGQPYHIIGALLVGSGPAASPYSPQFHPYFVPRIQVVDPTLVSPPERAWTWAAWEQRLLANPRLLYVSAGRDISSFDNGRTNPGRGRFNVPVHPYRNPSLN